jgi:hypothetical protein
MMIKNVARERCHCEMCSLHNLYTQHLTPEWHLAALIGAAVTSSRTASIFASWLIHDNNFYIREYKTGQNVDLIFYVLKERK